MSVCSWAVCWASNKHGGIDCISIIWKDLNINISAPSVLALFYLFSSNISSCVLEPLTAPVAHSWLACEHCHTALCPGCALRSHCWSCSCSSPGPAAGQDELNSTHCTSQGLPRSVSFPSEYFHSCCSPVVVFSVYLQLRRGCIKLLGSS